MTHVPVEVVRNLKSAMEKGYDSILLCEYDLYGRN